MKMTLDGWDALHGSNGASTLQEQVRAIIAQLNI